MSETRRVFARPEVARTTWLRIVVVALMTCLFPRSSVAEPVAYVHTRIEGVINPVKARHLQNALEKARTSGASFIVVSLDTPGGLVASMEEICNQVTNAKIPVVGFVEPKTAQATSAGAFILLATDIAAMAPNTRVGAAHPVGLNGSLDKVLDEKATNSLVSLAKSLAARRGRPEAIAEKIVRESASFTAVEAKDAKVVEIAAANLDDLLRQLDGRKIDVGGRSVTLATKGAIRIEYPMSRAHRILDAVTEPTVASILVTIGVLGILYELSSPGIGMAGIVGVLSLVLGLLGGAALPFEIGAVLLIVAGLIAIALEVKVPSHGLLGIGGIVALIAGGLLLIDEGQYFGAVQVVDFRIFAPSALISAALFIAVATTARRALAARPQSGLESFAGRHGHAKTPFESTAAGYAGTVFVDGARWQAVADVQIREGDAVEVVGVLKEPTRLEVRRLV